MLGQQRLHRRRSRRRRDRDRRKWVPNLPHSRPTAPLEGHLLWRLGVHLPTSVQHIDLPMSPSLQSRAICLNYQDSHRTWSVRHLSPHLPSPSAMADPIHAHSHIVDSPAHPDIPRLVYFVPLHHHTVTSMFSALYHKSTYHNDLKADLYLVPRFFVVSLPLLSPPSSPSNLRHLLLACTVDMCSMPISSVIVEIRSTPARLRIHMSSSARALAFLMACRLAEGVQYGEFQIG